MDMRATCVVLTHTRPGNVPTILRELFTVPEIAEVIVWNNNKDVQQELTKAVVSEFRSHPVNLVGCDRNLFTWGRWRAAMMASCGVVCTQDDDVLVSRDEWSELFRQFRAYDYERLTVRLDIGHIRWGRKEYIHRYHGGVAYETLVGWGGVFQRDWVRDAFDEYWAVQPYDELGWRKADRIFACMLERGRPIEIESVISHLTGAASSDALYRQRGFWKQNKEAVQRALRVLETRP